MRGFRLFTHLQYIFCKYCTLLWFLWIRVGFVCSHTGKCDFFFFFCLPRRHRSLMWLCKLKWWQVWVELCFVFIEVKVVEKSVIFFQHSLKISATSPEQNFAQMCCSIFCNNKKKVVSPGQNHFATFLSLSCSALAEWSRQNLILKRGQTNVGSSEILS